MRNGRPSLFAELEPELYAAVETVGKLAQASKRQVIEATIAERIDVPHPYRVPVRNAWAKYRRGER